MQASKRYEGIIKEYVDKDVENYHVVDFLKKKLSTGVSFDEYKYIQRYENTDRMDILNSKEVNRAFTLRSIAHIMIYALMVICCYYGILSSLSTIIGSIDLILIVPMVLRRMYYSSVNIDKVVFKEFAWYAVGVGCKSKVL